MIGQPRYKTPEAARAAVTDRLRSTATNGPWRLPDLQRQFAYDQLVERLYRLDPGWVIKGATALLARRVSVRHTLDLDVYRAGAIADVERQVREAAALDIGDWVRFEVGESLRVRAAGAQAARAKVSSYIGNKIWAPFQIDMVADGVEMTGVPDSVAPLTDVRVLDRDRIPWRAYPLVDHIADKVCAIFEVHDGRPSTRFKDLIDLVAITTHSSVHADEQLRALASEARRRDLQLPAHFDVPDRVLWRQGYQTEARRTVGLVAQRLEDAMDLVCPFIDPLLGETASEWWDPASILWGAVHS